MQLLFYFFFYNILTKLKFYTIIFISGKPRGTETMVGCVVRKACVVACWLVSLSKAEHD